MIFPVLIHRCENWVAKKTVRKSTRLICNVGLEENFRDIVDC